MNSYYLYQKKYQYERFIRNLNDCCSKLDTCYSNLLSCKKIIGNCIKINDYYYKNDEYEKIIKSIENDKYKIKNVILPQARYQYNKVLSEIAKL